MQWISIKDKKPENDGMCLVMNLKGWMTNIKARYDKDYDVFVLFDSQYHHCLTLDVTHYIEIPKPPEE